MGCRRGSDTSLLWLWRRPAATTPIQPLAWESPCTAEAALEMAKRPKKKKNKIKDTDFKIQEAQRASNKLNPNRPTARHIIIKMAKVKNKERILKAAREKQSVNYKGTPRRLSDGFTTGQKGVARYT